MFYPRYAWVSNDRIPWHSLVEGKRTEELTGKAEVDENRHCVSEEFAAVVAQSRGLNENYSLQYSTHFGEPTCPNIARAHYMPPDCREFSTSIQVTLRTNAMLDERSRRNIQSSSSAPKAKKAAVTRCCASSPTMSLPLFRSPHALV